MDKKESNPCLIKPELGTSRPTVGSFIFILLITSGYTYTADIEYISPESKTKERKVLT